MTHATAFGEPVVAGSRRRRPLRAPRRAAPRPRLERAGDPVARTAPAVGSDVRGGPGADHRGRWLRVVRQPRHRSPGGRVARRHDAVVPVLAGCRRARRSAGRARRVQWGSGVRRRARAGRSRSLRGCRHPLRHPAVRRRGAGRARPARAPAGVRGAGRSRPGDPARAARPHLGVPAQHLRCAHRRPPRPGWARHHRPHPAPAGRVGRRTSRARAVVRGGAGRRTGRRRLADAAGCRTRGARRVVTPGVVGDPAAAAVAERPAGTAGRVVRAGGGAAGGGGRRPP